MADRNKTHAETGYELLGTAWKDVVDREDVASDTALSRLIDQVFECKTVSYKRAVIVQTLGKATDTSLDAQAVQKGDADETAWNARTFAQQTLVKWNDEAKRPLSHSGDPYVSNPLRIPRIDSGQRFKARDKDGFDSLVEVLEQVNKSDSHDRAYSRLIEVLLGLRRWIADKDVDYPLPKRASLEVGMGAIDRFLEQKSGGARLQAVVAALLQTLASAGLKIGDITSGHINAPDAGAKSAGDVEFQGFDGRFSVEVKDRSLSEPELLVSIEKARIAETSDLMFVLRARTSFKDGLDKSRFDEICAAQFSSGLNIYLEKFGDFSRLVMSLAGESGRRLFLKNVGRSLDEQAVDISHKWAWADIVKSI